MSKIILNSVVGGINTDIIPHFLQYYKDIGVDDFYITLNIVENRYDKLDSVLGVFKDFNIEPLFIWIGPFSRHLKKRFMEEAMIKCLDNNCWILRADQDEFVDFGISLKDVVKECEDAKYLYIEGDRLERITTDGSLPCIKRGDDLFKLFPIKAEIKNNYGYKEGCKQKIVLAKKSVKVSEGAFHILVEDLPLECKYPKILNVHHFRWSSDIIRIWDRQTVVKNWRRRINKKRIEYIFIDGKRINMNNINVLE